MVVLDAGEDRRLGPVVEELGAAVEVGGVVLVALDDEALARAGVEAAPQVQRHAADEIARIGAAGGIDPGRQRGGGRLAVGAGGHQRLAAGEEEARQGLRHGDLVEAALARRGGDRVVARHRVAHHHQVGRRVQVGRVVAHQRLDPGFGQQIAHRRVERRVTATHPMAQVLEQAGERGHAGAADGDEEDVQGLVGHGRRGVFHVRFSVQPGCHRRWAFSRP